jgi:Zn-dependent peptidase ImmA (M78 family)
MTIIAPPGFVPAEECKAGKTHIDDFASKVAAKLGYAAGDPLEPIVTHLGGHIIYETLESLNPASIQVRKQGDFDIYLPLDTSPERDRFSIAHELGHYFLHFPETNNRAMYATRFGSTRVEWEANWFAAGFLMPAGEFKRLCLGFGGRRGLPAVARHFGVSLAAATARANALGL